MTPSVTSSDPALPLSAMLFLPLTRCQSRTSIRHKRTRREPLLAGRTLYCMRMTRARCCEGPEAANPPSLPEPAVR